MLRYVPASAGTTIEDELEKKARALEKALGISANAAKFLTLRGMDVEAARGFLYHGFDDLHDPFLLPGMDEGAGRIRKALSCGERIAVFGDYDADGVCATALLVRVLREHGANVVYYMPSRHTEGYGLNDPALDTIAAEGTGLVVTVDCGITAVAEAKHAKALGIDMVITDHHQPLDELPDAAACIAATLPGSRYPFPSLCGTGVAAKLAQALFGRGAMQEHAGIVGLATVADLVPLVGENRILVKEGLRALRQSPGPGIRALCECAKVKTGNLGAYHLGFVLGPRINAAGRMGDASLAVELLLTDDGEKAREIAVKLESDNAGRRRVEQEIFEQALTKLESVDLVRARALVLESEGWDHGVIGIVASRLTGMLCMPVILFSRDGDLMRGSGRSVEGVHLFEALRPFEHMFVKFGGHAQAAGMTMHLRHFDAFAKGFEELVRTRYDEDLFMPSMRYDIRLAVDDVSAELVMELERFEPFGIGNPAPVIRVAAPGARGVTAIGADKRHMRFCIPSRQGELECIAFGESGRAAELREGTGFEMLVTPQINRWRDRERLQCLVRHFNLTEAMRSPQAYIAPLKQNFADAIAMQILYNRNVKYVCADNAFGGEEALETLLLSSLKDCARGTLIICNTPAGAVHALSLLTRLRLLDRVQVVRNRPARERAAFNTLLLAPLDPAGACAAFARAVAADALPLNGTVPENLLQYAGYDAEAAAGFIETALFTRQELLRIHARLKRLLDKQRTFADAGALSGALCDGSRSAVQLRLALRILGELGLLAVQKTDAGLYCGMGAVKGRTTLDRSQTYRRMRAYLSALRDTPEADG
jgi:single-stranded-DNA-specific exonuclease